VAIRSQVDADVTAVVAVGRGSQPARAVVLLGQGIAFKRSLPACGSWVIGRDETCDVVVPHPSISRRHARLHIGQTVAIEDLGSSNGTVVGGWRLGQGQPTALVPGQPVTLAGFELFIVAALERTRTPEVGLSIASAEPHSDPIVQRIAAGNLNVLIMGEAGVGKVDLAETIHCLSGRPRPLHIHCASFVDDILRRQLLGNSTRDGVDTSRPISIILEAVHELDQHEQAGIWGWLRTLELPPDADVRVIATAAPELPGMVETNRFRRDLFVHLNGATLTVPPLRYRPQVIAPLAQRLLADIVGSTPQASVILSEEALQWLSRQPWRGNVGELRNALRRAVLLCAAPQLKPSDFNTRVRAALRRSPADRDQINDALVRCMGNQTRAAKMLGISRRTLVRRIEQYGLPRPRKSADELD
jgi:hypothetical protein